MASRETLPILKGLTLGQNLVYTWASIAEITDKFIMGLDVSPDYNVFIHLGHQML
jgi:hypothetical protein